MVVLFLFVGAVTGHAVIGKEFNMNGDVGVGLWTGLNSFGHVVEASFIHPSCCHQFVISSFLLEPNRRSGHLSWAPDCHVLLS